MEIIKATGTVHYNRICDECSRIEACDSVIKEERIIESEGQITEVLKDFSQKSAFYERARLFLTFAHEKSRTMFVTRHNKYPAEGALNTAIDIRVEVLNGVNAVLNRNPCDYSCFLLQSGSKAYLVAATFFKDQNVKDCTMENFKEFQLLTRPLFHEQRGN